MVALRMRQASADGGAAQYVSGALISDFAGLLGRRFAQKALFESRSDWAANCLILLNESEPFCLRNHCLN